jgi:spore maturation protein SpmB
VAGGFLAVALVQRLKLWDPVLLGWILAVSVLLGGGVALIARLPHDRVETVSTTLGTALMLASVLWFLGLATFRRINAWEVFVEGAKEGFRTALAIIPFLVGILVAVGVFRASGGMDLVVRGIWACVAWTGLPAASVGAFPTMLMKPLSGAGARGLTLDAMRTFGVDSFTGRLSCLLQGSTDTTLYVIALYAGAIGLKRTRYVLPSALCADLCGFLGAFAMALVFFR